MPKAAIKQEQEQEEYQVLENIEETIVDLEHRFEHNDYSARIRPVFENCSPMDIGYIVSHINDEYQKSLLKIVVELPKLHEILHDLEEELLIKTIKILKKRHEEKIAPLFEKLDPDDTVDILTRLPEELAEWVHTKLGREVRSEINPLLAYEDGKAGRMMSPDVFSMSCNATVREALKAIKSSPDAEMVYYTYIVDRKERLVGVVSLRELVTKSNRLSMKEIMREDVISVDVHLDQEEVAQKVERYNLSAIPVIDEKEKLVGIITVDDVIDVIRAESTEDIMKLAGTSEEELTTASSFKGFLLRMPWLLVSFFGGMLTVQSVNFFTGNLPHVLLLAFVPIIGGMGGNIGSQSSTIIVRGLATGKIVTSELWSIFFREVKTGILLGLFFGTLLGIMAELQFAEAPLVGIMVAMGMVFSMFLAAAIGSIMPMIFEKFKIDPAVAAGPFVSTTIDNVGLMGYFSITILLTKYFL